MKKRRLGEDGQVDTDHATPEIMEELGDVLWYISACADELGLTLQEIAEYNVNKLAKRHGR